MRKIIAQGALSLLLGACLLLSGCGGSSSGTYSVDDSDYSSGSSSSKTYSGASSGGGKVSTSRQEQQVLPDPSAFLGAEGELVESGFQFEGLDTEFDLYCFYWPSGETESRTGSGWNRYLSALESRGFTYAEDTDADGIPFYYVYGEDGTALIPWYGSKIEFYIPSTMAFVLGDINSAPSSGGGSSESSSSGGGGGFPSSQGSQVLPDPGVILGVDGELAATGYQIEGIDAVFDVYTYSWSLVGGNPVNTGWTLYLASLESHGFTYTEEKAADDNPLYLISGEDSMALALKVSSGFDVSIELYVPSGMAFVPGGQQRETGGTGLPSGGGSFQNGSYLEAAGDASVSDSPITCILCHGSGSCDFCNGSGISVNPYQPDIRNICSACDGTGVCNICNGTGLWN